jgi:ABC-type nitrate/sulfonate/bicarbonate transport system substrate-binding protein
LQAVKEGFRELPYHQPPWLSSPIVASDELLARDRSMLRSFVRAVLKGHLYYGQNPAQAVAVTQKVQRIDSPVVAKQIYEDDMLRHNPGGGLEEAAMRKVVERSREMLKVQRKVELSEIFDLSMAKEAEAELKKSKWEP